MSLPENLGPRRAWAGRRALIAASAAVIVAGGAAAALVVTTSHGSSVHHDAAKTGRLAAAACTGPAGAAYVALPGYQAFDAVDTSDCNVVQQYNVGDTQVPGDPGDFNYDSTEEGVAMYGDTLYFADTGNDTVAVMDAATLDPDNYANPTETLIHVGFNPGDLAVTPDGSQVWVADTGPQSGSPSLGGISVIATATDAVTATIPLQTDPREIAFSPSGARAYVTSGAGLLVINTTTRQVVAFINGLGDPQGVAVAPDGKTVYVTDTVQGSVKVISAATNTVKGTIKVGQMPWQLAVSSDGSTIYVADGDSNAISVIASASDKVTNTIPDAGGPVSLALTPDGSELWVGGLTSAVITVFETGTDTLVGSVNAGYENKPNFGDGDEPTAIVMTTTPTPGS